MLKIRLLSCVLLLTSFVTLAQAQWRDLNPVTSVEKQTDGVLFQMKTGATKLQVCSDSIVRVLYSPTGKFPDTPDYVVTKKDWPAAQWSMQESGDNVVLSTARLKVTVSKSEGSIQYASADGQKLVMDQNRWMTPVKVNGEDTFRAGRLHQYLWVAGSIVRIGATPERRLELSRRLGGHIAGQHQYCGAHAGFEQRVWDFLEQRFAQPRE